MAISRILPLQKHISVLSLSTLLFISACSEEESQSPNEATTATELELTEEANDTHKPNSDVRVMDALALVFPAGDKASEAQATISKTTPKTTPATNQGAPSTSWKEVESAREEIWEKSKETSEDIWKLSKKSSQEAWQKGKASSKEIWEDGKESSQELWAKGQQKSAETWQEIEQSSEKIWQESSEKMEDIFESFNSDDQSSDTFDNKNKDFAEDEI